MRDDFSDAVERSRVGGQSGDANGHYLIKRGNAILSVRSSNGGGWDHVSVSRKTRCPTWDEMCWVKDQFFRPDECVMQLHPPKAENVNCHPFCLHLWRPQTVDEIADVAADWAIAGERFPYSRESPGAIPRPPSNFVGPKQAVASAG